MLIGISGKMQSGKDTSAQLIKTFFLKNHKIIHFADPLKDMCINYMGLKEDDIYTSKGKQSYNEFWGMTNRQILQKVGTQAFRNGFRNDFWVKLMQLKLSSKCQSLNYLIPDVRFDDQAQMIKRNGGYIINIIRDDSLRNVRQSNHKSQKGITENCIDFNIYNNGTIEQLKENLFKVLNEIRKTIIHQRLISLNKELLCYEQLINKIDNFQTYIYTDFSKYSLIQIQCFSLGKENEEIHYILNISQKESSIYILYGSSLIYEKKYDKFDQTIINQFNRLMNLSKIQ